MSVSTLSANDLISLSQSRKGYRFNEDSFLLAQFAKLNPNDAVLCNPPFWKKGTGKLPHHFEKKVSKHEWMLDMKTLVKAARFFLKPEGSLFLRLFVVCKSSGSIF